MASHCATSQQPSQIKYIRDFPVTGPMNSLQRSIFAVFSGRVTKILLSAAFTPVLVRILSQEQYGLYASILAGISIATLISRGGLFDATRKLIGEHNDSNDEVSSIISVALSLSVAYGMLAIGIAFLSLYTKIIPSEYVPYVWIFFAAVLFGNIFSIVKGFFYGVQSEHLSEILDISQRLIYIGLALFLAYIGYDVFGVFIGYSLSFLLVSLFGMAALAKCYPYYRPTPKQFIRYGKDLASFGGYQLIGGLSALLLYRIDILLVKFFEGSSSTALYQSAILPAEMIWFVPSAIQMTFLQHTASLWADGDIEAINENLKEGIKYAVLSLTLFGAGLFVLADSFLEIYFGLEYVEASATLRVLIFGTFFFGITRVVVPVFQATGWVRYTELVTFGSLLLNILLNILLIPRYGIIGAGVGTGISYVAIFIGNIVLWNYSPFNRVSVRWTGKLIAVQGLFATSFWAITKFLELPPLTSLMLLPPVGFALFVGINVVAGYIPLQYIADQLDH